MKGILDRFEDNGKAVILIEEINKEIIVPIEGLPKGSKENVVFNIEKKNEEFVIISIDYQTTVDKTNKLTDLMDKLRKKSGGSKFKRN